MMRTYRLRPTADLRRLRGAASASRSTMRDCQPGPLAFQRARMSGGMRRLMLWIVSACGDVPRIFGGVETDVHGFNAYIRKGKPGAEHGRALGGGKLAGTVMPIEGDENCCREKVR